MIMKRFKHFRVFSEVITDVVTRHYPQFCYFKFWWTNYKISDEFYTQDQLNAIESFLLNRLSYMALRNAKDWFTDNNGNVYFYTSAEAEAFIHFMEKELPCIIRISKRKSDESKDSEKRKTYIRKVNI